MTQTPSKKGRPQKYTPALAKEICDVISSTSKGTKKLCEEHIHWPCQDTLFTWLKTYPGFSELYAKSKRLQVEFIIDEILEISDDATQDSFIDAQGKTVFNPQAVNRARLKIDTRKWLASKLVPRVYGVKPDDEVDKNEKLSQEAMKHEKELEEYYRKKY